jgi:translation initiation factor IF-1
MRKSGAEQGAGGQGVVATVVELLPQATCRVELEGRQQVLAHAAGARKNFVRVRPGDRVRVELSAHDKTRGRIVELLS